MAPRQGIRRVPWCIRAAIFAAVIAGGGDPHAAAAQPLASPCDIRTTERVVAVGDVHGAYDSFVSILREAGLVNRRGRWSGGRSILIQTGDVLDRGPDSRKVIDLLQRLERDAARSGGRVYSLLGNHEFMRLVDDWRYVSAEELAAFTNAESSALREQVLQRLNARAEQQADSEKRTHDAKAFREQFMKDIPLGFLEMRVAFGADAGYGRWIRSRHAAVKINGVLFLHGGVSEGTSPLGCDGINKAIRDEMASLPVPPEQVTSLLATSETGPLWYRGLASEPEETFTPTFDTILRRVDARAIVIGHTPVLPGRIATRFGGRVIQLDSGMLDGKFFPGGVPSALEWHGESVTAIYPDRRERLTLPALAVPAAP
jgi:hypothetical protein